MRSPVDLIELPYSFTQLSLLTEQGVIKEAEKRDVCLRPATLEGLHRLGLFVPFLRVSRDRREILRAQKHNPALAHQLAFWEHTQSWSLKIEHQRGRVHDGVHFLARSRLKRTLEARDYESSMYLYSPHQLVALPAVSALLPHLDYDDSGAAVGLRLGKRWLEWERAKASADRDVAVAVSALEPVYLPEINRRVQMSSSADFERYERWRQQLRLGSLLRWLKVHPDWLRDTAASLLHRADHVDPLGAWFEVVREGAPDRWELLSGRARTAIDLRTSAEVLVRYYEHLAQAGRAKPLPEPPPGRWGRSEFEHRLKPKGGLDETLTRFGLSPHPQLLLVLEGATELLLFPRVMKLFGLRTDDDFISIHDAEGVTKSITSLVGYAISPRGVAEEEGKYLMLSRPPTRLLNVMDAEAQFATTESRTKRKQKWVERIERSLPSQQRTPQMREAIKRLIHIDVWSPNGASFEFAHFGDRQLATAIDALDHRSRKPSMDDLVKAVGNVRQCQGNLDRLLGGTSKRKLADALWPVLEAKINAATERGTERRIPIVRMLDLATDLARESPRRGVLLPITT